ncbi:hypothetical protein WJX74_009354 [Apatococcus lobatus]|uniref:Uncharacterized protein n=1 Tax=Apatococcus lobatus TaxID=904363 RepID=A0AAW1QUF6_9CHLO
MPASALSSPQGPVSKAKAVILLLPDMLRKRAAVMDWDLHDDGLCTELSYWWSCPGRYKAPFQDLVELILQPVYEA